MSIWRERSRRPPSPDQNTTPADAWEQHVQALAEAGIPAPGQAGSQHKPATKADEQARYQV